MSLKDILNLGRKDAEVFYDRAAELDTELGHNGEYMHPDQSELANSAQLMADVTLRNGDTIDRGAYAGAWYRRAKELFS
jgi:hypothetical protein